MRCSLIPAAALFCLLALAPAPAGAVPPAGPPELSYECGECHRDIYTMWRKSAHAQSMEDEIFLQAYHGTEAREGKEVSRVCLHCHAPLAEQNRDWALAQKSTWEGVSCNVCHSLVSVEITPEGTHPVLDVGRVKRGPIKDAESSAHEVAYSPLHATSEACAWCHEYRNAEGVSLMSTYSEWKDSSAAKEQKTCQSCHMGRTEADVVDPKVARVPQAEVNLHEVPGGHSLEQLHKAFSVAIDPQRGKDSLTVQVRLTNKGAGHAVPTGMPGRRVVLDLEVRDSNGNTYHAERTYGRVFADADGQVITRDCGYFAHGVTPVSDTRIKPDERRVENFSFPIPSEATAYVTLRLHYEHEPTGGPEGRVYLTFLAENRTVRGE